MLLSKLAPSRGLARLVGGQLRVLSAPPHHHHQRPRWTSTAAPPKSSLRLGVTGGLFAAGVGLGLAWAHWGDDVLPKVEAATPIPTPGSRRRANNFIADVVKSCSHGVVYIEILDSRFNRSDQIIFLVRLWY